MEEKKALRKTKQIKSNAPSSIEDSVVRLIEFIGEDVNREGLKRTPERYIKALLEMTQGYKQSPKEILSTTFSEGNKYDELILCTNVDYFSTCEHHILPFYGKIHFAYVPKKRVVGLSKIARLIDCFAKRLQIQERMTRQITQAFMKEIKPLGCACVVTGIHLCMKCRGVKKPNSTMITSSLEGIFKTNKQTRLEFFNLIGGK